MPRRQLKRGYLTALLIGLDGKRAAVWNVYSESVLPVTYFQDTDSYEFYEAIINTLRPIVNQGIKSILVAAPNEKDFKKFISHVEKHHSWLLGGWSMNTVTIEYIQENAMNVENVRELVKSEKFKIKFSYIQEKDTKLIMETFEKIINDSESIPRLLFSLKEVENAVYIGDEIEYILITENFRLRHNRRINRLMQVASNRSIKRKILKDNTTAGHRIAQFGGLVCILS